MTKVSTLDLIDVCAFRSLSPPDMMMAWWMSSDNQHIFWPGKSQIFSQALASGWGDGTSVFDAWQVKRASYRLEMAVFMPGHEYNPTQSMVGTQTPV